MYTPPPVDWRSYPRTNIYQQQQFNYAEQQQPTQSINMYATMPFVYPTPPPPVTILGSAPPSALASPHSATLSQPVQPQHAFIAQQTALSARGGRGGRQQQQFNFQMDGTSSPASMNRGEEKEFTPRMMSALPTAILGNPRPHTTGGMRGSNPSSTSGGIHAGDPMFRFSSLSTTATPLLPADYSALTVEEELAARKHYKVIDADVKQTSATNFPTKDYGTPLDRERERLRKALVRFHTLQTKENQAKKAAASASLARGIVSPRSPQTKRYNIADAFTDYAPTEIPPIRPTSSYAHTGRRRTVLRKSAPTTTNQTARATPNVSRPTTAVAPVHVTPQAALRPATALSATIQLPLTGAWSKSPHDTPASMRNVPFWLPVTKREGQALMDEVLDSGPAVLHTAASPTHGGDLSIEIHKQVEREFRHTHIPEEELLRLEELNRLQDEHETNMRAKRDRDPYRYDPAHFEHAGSQPANHPSAYVPYLGKQLQQQERQLGAISNPKGPEVFYYYAMDGSLQTTTLPPAINSPSAVAVAASASASPSHQQAQSPLQTAPALPLGIADPALPNLLGWVMSLHPERMALRQAAGRWRRQMARRAQSRSNSPTKFYTTHAQENNEEQQDTQEEENDQIQLQTARSDGKPPTGTGHSSKEESHFRRESHETHASGQQTPMTASDSKEEFFGSNAITRSPYYSLPMPVVPSPPDKSLDNLPGWKREILLAEQRQKDQLKSQREWARRQEAEDMVEELKELEAKNRTGGMTAEEKRVYDLLHRKPAAEDDGSNLMLYPISNQKDPRSLLSLIPSNERMVDNLAFPEPFHVSHLEPAELNRQPKPNWRALGDSREDEARRHQEMLEQEAFFQMPDMPHDDAKDQDGLVLQKRKSAKKRRTDRENTPIAATRAVEPEQPAPSGPVEASTQTDDFELTAVSAAAPSPVAAAEPGKEETPPVPAEIKRREHLYDWFRSDNCQFLSQSISSNLTPHTPWLHALVVETRAYEMNDDQLAQLLSIMNKNLGNNPCAAAEDVLAAFMDAADVLGLARKTPMPSIRILPNLPAATDATAPQPLESEQPPATTAVAVSPQHLSDAEVQQLQPTKATADYVQPFSSAQHFEHPQEQIEGAQPIEPAHAHPEPASQELAPVAQVAVEQPPSVLEVPAASPSDLPFSSNPELAIQQSAVQGEKELPDSVENDEEHAQKSLVFLHDIFRDSGSRLIGGELQGLIEEDGVAAPWLKVLLGEMLEKYHMKPAALMALLRDLIDSTPKHVVATNVSSDPAIETVIEKETVSDVTAFTYSDLVARILKHKELRDGETREKQRIIDEERMAKEQEEQKKKQEAEVEAETARKLQESAAEEEARKKQERGSAEQAQIAKEVEATAASVVSDSQQPIVELQQQQLHQQSQSEVTLPQPSAEVGAPESASAAPAVKTYSLKKRDSQPSQLTLDTTNSEIHAQSQPAEVVQQSQTVPHQQSQAEQQLAPPKSDPIDPSSSSVHSEPQKPQDPPQEIHSEPHVVPVNEVVEAAHPIAPSVPSVNGVSSTPAQAVAEPTVPVGQEIDVSLHATPEVGLSVPTATSVVQNEPTSALVASVQHAPLESSNATTIVATASDTTPAVSMPAPTVESHSTGIDAVKETASQLTHPEAAGAAGAAAAVSESAPQNSVASDHPSPAATVSAVAPTEITAATAAIPVAATPIPSTASVTADEKHDFADANPVAADHVPAPPAQSVAEPLSVPSEASKESMPHITPVVSDATAIPDTTTAQTLAHDTSVPASSTAVAAPVALVSAAQSDIVDHPAETHAPAAVSAAVIETATLTTDAIVTDNVKQTGSSSAAIVRPVVVERIDSNPLLPAAIAVAGEGVQSVNVSVVNSTAALEGAPVTEGAAATAQPQPPVQHESGIY